MYSEALDLLNLARVNLGYDPLPYLPESDCPGQIVILALPMVEIVYENAVLLDREHSHKYRKLFDVWDTAVVFDETGIYVELPPAIRTMISSFNNQLSTGKI